MKLGSKELLRYSKQILLKNIGVAGQKKISNTKVLIIGVGGLGCPLAMYLANMGIGHIGLIDHDKIELSNLNRQILYTSKDLSKYKVIQAKKFLGLINKKIKVNILKKKIDEKNANNIIKKYQIICDCTDNFSTRYLINKICSKNKKILISAAINKFEAQVFNFNFLKNIPCYRCFMPELPSADNMCDSEGILPSVAGIAASIQANEVIKSILFKKNDLVGKLISFNTLDLNFRKIKLSKNSKCQTCGIRK